MLLLSGLAMALGACTAEGGSTNGPAGGTTPSTPHQLPSAPASTGQPRAATPLAAGHRPAAAGTRGPCGTAESTPRRYQHVIWIWMENKNYANVVGSSQAPYETRLANACGLATNYAGVAHPSLPNYLAATGGSTFGVTDDAGPDAHPITAPSLFGELTQHGKQWRSYVESMPGNCALSSSGEYAVKHNPAVYYRRIRRQCDTWDVPMGGPTAGAFASALAGGELPAFSLVIPNLCDDTHDCSVAHGDAWLAQWIPRIVTSLAYRRGHTVVFLTWDEGEGGQHIPLIVVSPSTRPGTRLRRPLNHYALVATTARLLGVPAPGHAATAPFMGGFGLEPN